MKNIKFNFIKTEDNKGHWRTYHPQNNLIKKLKNKKNIYISVNKFLNYKEHATYKFQNNALFRYGLIDIDGQNFSSKKEADKYFLEIIKFLKEEICIEKIVCTNTTLGGYQIHIQPCCYARFSQILKEHPKIFLKADNRVHDSKRVSRMENTWNGNRGCMAFEISKDLNMSELKKMLSQSLTGSGSPIQQVQGIGSAHDLYEAEQTAYALGMPYLVGQGLQVDDANSSDLATIPQVLKSNEANDNGAVQTALTPSHNKGRAIGQEEDSLPHYFMVKQLNSSIKPLKSLYCCVMKFRGKMGKNRLKRLQKAYNLGDIYSFKTHNGYCYISPKAFQARRLEKIYKKAGAWSSLNELIKFKTNWIYASNIYDTERFINVPTFKYIDFYPSDTWGGVSRQHLAWLSKYHKADYDLLIGDEKPRIFIGMFSTQ